LLVMIENVIYEKRYTVKITMMITSLAVKNIFLALMESPLCFTLFSIFIFSLTPNTSKISYLKKKSKHLIMFGLLLGILR